MLSWIGLSAEEIVGVRKGVFRSIGASHGEKGFCPAFADEA